MSEEKQFRMVCKNFGKSGHQPHEWKKINKHSAEQSVIDANHSAEMKGIHKHCAPFSVQERAVTHWVASESEVF